MTSVNEETVDMANSQLPKLLFVGAGNIAQSIMKGILRAKPQAAKHILATAPTMRNLSVIKDTLGCRTTLLNDAVRSLDEFDPDFVFLCVKPQVLLASRDKGDELDHLLKSTSDKCTMLSLLAGLRSDLIASFVDKNPRSIVRVMLNTATEIRASTILWYSHPDMDSTTEEKVRNLFESMGQTNVKLGDEKLMDVATGICGSGIAFFYEMIQTVSDVGVKNGLSRADATQLAAQLSKSAGEMLIFKQQHPYQLRDDVTSPAGTTIYGLSNWHENSIGYKISQAFQASIDRAKSLSSNILPRK